MTEKYRYRDVQQAWGTGGVFELNLNDLYPEPEVDAEGNPVPTSIKRPRLDSREKWRLLQPFISGRLKDQLKAVIPLLQQNLTSVIHHNC